MVIRRPGIVVSVIGVGLLVLLLGSCGSSEDPTAVPRPTATTAPSATTAPVPTAVPTPTAVPPPTGPKKGGTLRYVESFDTRSFSPLRVTTSETSFLEPIFGYLVGITRDIVLEPQMAESWEAGADGSSLTFFLKPGVKFHDGSDFNAAAVKDHLDKILDPEWAALGQSVLAPISSVEVRGELTVRLNFKFPDVVVLARLARRDGMVPSKKAMEAVTPATLTEFSLNPVGAGPFKFVSRRADSNVKFERWDKSHPADRGLPHLDGLELRIIADRSVALAAFRAQDIDTMDSTQDQVALIENQRGVVVHQGFDPAYGYLHFNRTMGPLSDVRVRRAISHALDREALVQGIYKGNAVPLYAQIPPHLTELYDPNYVKFPYDPAEAKRLLAEAGYADGFKMPGPTVWYTGERGLPLANVLKDMLGKVGIELELQLLPGRDAYQGHFLQHKTPMIILSISCPEDPDRCFREHFHSASPQYSQGAPIPGLDALIDKQRTIFDPVERNKILLQARDLIVDNQIDVFTVANKVPLVYWDYVKNYESWPGGDGLQRHWTIWLDK